MVTINWTDEASFWLKYIHVKPKSLIIQRVELILPIKHPLY